MNLARSSKAQSLKSSGGFKPQPSQIISFIHPFIIHPSSTHLPIHHSSTHSSFHHLLIHHPSIFIIHPSIHSFIHSAHIYGTPSGARDWAEANFGLFSSYEYSMSSHRAIAGSGPLMSLNTYLTKRPYVIIRAYTHKQ